VTGARQVTRRDAAYYFAQEDYLLQQRMSSEALMLLWQTEPTVMVGQYQLPLAEFDQKRARTLGITLVRRPSGGGAIYTDAGTVQFSLVLPGAADLADPYPQAAAREQCAKLLVAALRELGIATEQQGRNDIVLSEGALVGKKIAGMAQFARGTAVCTHASLLFDTNLEVLADLLRVDDEKFRSKAVTSVRSRVSNIKDYATDGAADHASALQDCCAQQFLQHLRCALLQVAASCGLASLREYQTAAADLPHIESIFCEKYGNPEWTLAKTPPFTTHSSKRFSAGKLDAYFQVRKGVVAQCALHGDFLGTLPVAQLQATLVGLPFTRTDFAAALQSVDLRPYLGDITGEEFLTSVFD